MSLKIAIITSTRAEYGLLSPLIKKCVNDSYFEPHLIVTGTHLSKKYGNTIDTIYADENPIKYKVPIINEQTNDICLIIAKGIYKFSKLYKKENYDAIIVLGDRYELYAFCIPAVIMNIPIVHIHGGERTEGAIDERIRHSITKMASLHFASIPEYAKRIIQLGENPNYVHSVGALGIDNIVHFTPLTQIQLENELNIRLDIPTALMTFHPVTLDKIEKIKEQGEELFEALKASKLQYIVTMPNNDAGNEILNEIITQNVFKYPQKFKFRKNLGQQKYLSLLHYVKMVVGNSSSGLIEVPSFGIPTINIGDRQKGRFSPKTVIHCPCKKDKILSAIEYGLTIEFKKTIENYKSPYGVGNTANTIIEILKKTDFKSEELSKKEFFDVEFKI